MVKLEYQIILQEHLLLMAIITLELFAHDKISLDNILYVPQLNQMGSNHHNNRIKWDVTSINQCDLKIHFLQYLSHKKDISSSFNISNFKKNTHFTNESKKIPL